MSSDKSYNILIVDDEGQVATIMQKYLSFHDEFRNIVVAANGVEAMHKISNQEFDLIITDIVMPKRDGLALIEHLRNIPKYFHTKIMIVSGCLSKDVCIVAMRKGVRQILVKPFTARQLLEKTFEILKISKNTEQDVDKLLHKIANKVALDLSTGQKLSEEEVSQLVNAYKSENENK